MNYWIVSPNLGDGRRITKEKWKKSIQRLERVFMGWGVTNKRHGAKFANNANDVNGMNIGDLVLIAYRKDYKWSVVLCGLIASKSKYERLKDTPKRAQNRKLNFVIPKERLEMLNLNFKDCSFNKMVQIPAMCRLKPEENIFDKKLIGILTREINSNKEDNSAGQVFRQTNNLKKQQVEISAINKVTDHFTSLNYKVISKEKDNIGWDLEASKNSEKLLLEVKGLSGNTVAIELTPNEYQKSKDKKKYKLCIVTSALSRPVLEIFSFDANLNSWTNNNNEKLVIEERIGARMQKG